MKKSGFNESECWRISREELNPVFQGLSPEPYLDSRNVFYLKMLAECGALERGMHLGDLGAGLAIFGPLAAKLGLQVTLVDDFGGGGGIDRAQREAGDKVLNAFRDKLGIGLAEQNFLEQPLPFATQSVDIVTCFHSLEHWHHSPKKLFAEIHRVLRPGGVVFIATPNAVNIRKRISVLFGRSNFPTLNEWYHEGDPVFRGHVREPVIRDLHQLLRWNGFEVISTEGRNFIGRQSIALSFLPRPLTNFIAASSDRLLRFFPTLCSDIHVIGRKT